MTAQPYLDRSYLATDPRGWASLLGRGMPHRLVATAEGGGGMFPQIRGDRRWGMEMCSADSGDCGRGQGGCTRRLGATAEGDGDVRHRFGATADGDGDVPHRFGATADGGGCFHRFGAAADGRCRFSGRPWHGTGSL